MSPKRKKYIYQRDKYKCCKCGSKKKLQIDHIIPRSKGGQNYYQNYQILCEDCNSRKGSSFIVYTRRSGSLNYLVKMGYTVNLLTGYFFKDRDAVNTGL